LVQASEYDVIVSIDDNNAIAKNVCLFIFDVDFRI